MYWRCWCCWPPRIACCCRFWRGGIAAGGVRRTGAAGVAGTGGAVGGLVGNAVKDFLWLPHKGLEGVLLIHVNLDLMGKRNGKLQDIDGQRGMSAKRLGTLQNLTYW